jgi:hypothetical protein
VEPSGSVTVKPEATTIYTLLAYGPDSSISAALTVDVKPDLPDLNLPPIANAGPDQVVSTNVAQLDGTQSKSRAPGELTYLWELINPPGGFQNVVIQGADTATPTVTLLSGPVAYIFELTVTDSRGEKARDRVRITYQW